MTMSPTTGLSSIGNIISSYREGLLEHVARLDIDVPARNNVSTVYARHTKK